MRTCRCVQAAQVAVCWRWYVRLTLLCSLWLPAVGLAGQVKPTRRILILNEVGTSYPLINLVDEGIRTALANSPYRIEFYREYMDTILFPDASDQRLFRDFYIHKYQNRRPDVVITVGSSPLRFVAEAHERSFSGVPVVFCFPNVPGESGKMGSDFTGVDGDIDTTATVRAALQLLPDTVHLVVVGGTAPYDRRQQVLVKQQLRTFEHKLDISYLTDLAIPALLERLRHLPSHTVVLITAFGKDPSGRSYNANESGPIIVAASNAPVFSLVDRYFNHGELGGDISSALEDGKIAGSIAVRILSGEKPGDIPVVKAATTYMFDWKALKRWGLEEAKLPPGSIVVNRQPTPWESYKWYIIGGLSLIMFQTVLIVELVRQRARLTRAEGQLAMAFESAQESERRFRLVANTAPVMIWMSGPNRQFNYFNEPWFDFMGRPLAEAQDGWVENVHPEDLQSVLNTYTESFEQRKPFTMQHRLRRNDGTFRWILNTGVPRLNSDGSFAGFIGSCIDITDRKLAEEALSSFSHKLIDAQEQERTRIARELHDDINQRIAMLSVDLDILEHGREDSEDERGALLRRVRSRVMEIGSDIQALAHRLHSSKLEYLGLVPACRSFCKEMADHHKATVNFTARDVPANLPQDISLCLFRVLQEALSNAIKYSGGTRFEAQLTAESEEIRLTVRDNGVGFDSVSALNSPGLGLVSMRERVSCVKGTMAVTSQELIGTQITVHIPLSTVQASEIASNAA